MTDFPNPYELLAEVPSFEVTSTDVSDGVPLPTAQVSGIMGAGGSDTSPQLSWRGFPTGTKSFAVTCYDPKAPTASGFWHWAVCDIPADCTELPTDAGGAGGVLLPEGSLRLPNDAGMKGYLGAAPPEGNGVHTYYFVVHAVDVETLGIGGGSTGAFLGFNLSSHTLARGMVKPIYER